MIQILEYTEGKIIAAKATKSLTAPDYYKLLPILVNTLKKYRTIRLYFELDEELKLDQFWKRVKFEEGHVNALEKVAILGNQEMEQWMSELLRPFTSAEVRYFNPSMKEEAIYWINC